MAEDTTAHTFFFADHLILDDSPTRDFYKSVLQGLIHKNNNVFGVIQGFSSLILMDEVPDLMRENVEQMRDSSINASDLARIILTTAGCARVSTETISLSDLLPHIEYSARDKCERAGVPLEFNARAGDLPMITADGGRLSELLGELIKNAAEAAADVPGGEVAIDVLPPGDASPAEDGCIDIFIRNSSKDLSDEDIRGAFVPFQGDKGSDHYGIGLTTAGVLAGQMGMRFGLRCADGTTTAWLSLPAVASEA